MKDIDLFGSQILFRFNGSPTHNTRFGSLFTVALVGVIGLRLFFIIKDVFLRNNPQVIYQERQVDNPAIFTMNKNTFQLAFGMQDPNFEQYIDDQIYTVKLTQRHKSTFIDEKTGEAADEWVDKDVELRRCTIDNFPDEDTRPYFEKLKYNNMYCLPLEEDLFIEGDFSSESYYFLRLTISRCKTNCKPDPDIEKYLNYAFFSMQFSDVTIDPTQKDKPFKKYSRDSFFSTSLKMPKEVDFYMRNNYIESDYGWVTEDLQTVSYPQFSKSESSVFPTDFSEFLFQMIIRFEKQKENYYQRKYKNINNIVSEIGGFTQSLLAIGFLICTRLSQLDLNKEIINEAFNYESVDFEEEKLKQLYAAGQQSPNYHKPYNSKREEVSLENIQQSFTKKKLGNNSPVQKPPHSQFMKSDQFQLNNSENKGMFLRPISMDPNLHSNNQSFTNGLINQNLSATNIPPQQYNQVNSNIKNNNKLNSPRGKGISEPKNPHLRNIEEIQQGKFSHMMNQQPAENEKHFLSFLIQNPSSRIKNHSKDNKDELQYPISSDHEKLRMQQHKLEEKEQKLKEGMFKKLMQKATSSMTLNVVEYLKFFFWPFGLIKQKKKIIDYSIDKLYYHLDVLYVVKKLMEVDKLKRILLNPDQLSLFEYIPKPTIKSNYGYCQKASDIKFQIDSHYQDNRSELQKAQEAYSAFQNIVSKQNISILDSKIIELLDQKLLNLFGISQNTRETVVQSPRIPNIESSLSINNFQISYQKDVVKEKEKSNSNSDEDRNDRNYRNDRIEKKEEVLNQTSQIIPLQNIMPLNSPHFDSQRSMFSDIAGNEDYQKQNQIHEFENANPKRLSE